MLPSEKANSRPGNSALLFTALVAGGLLAAKLLFASPRRRSRTTGDDPQRAFARLRTAIIGNDKSAVAAVFGRPRASAGFAALAPALLVGSDARHADTWYYPLNRRRRRAALVVQFVNDVARDALLVHPPLQRQLKRT